MNLHATDFSGRKNSQNKIGESHTLLLLIHKGEAKLNHLIGITKECILLFPLNFAFRMNDDSTLKSLQY